MILKNFRWTRFLKLKYRVNLSKFTQLCHSIHPHHLIFLLDSLIIPKRLPEIFKLNQTKFVVISKYLLKINSNAIWIHSSHIEHHFRYSENSSDHIFNNQSLSGQTNHEKSSNQDSVSNSRL